MLHCFIALPFLLGQKGGLLLLLPASGAEAAAAPVQFLGHVSEIAAVGFSATSKMVFCRKAGGQIDLQSFPFETPLHLMGLQQQQLPGCGCCSPEFLRQETDSVEVTP